MKQQNTITIFAAAVTIVLSCNATAATGLLVGIVSEFLFQEGVYG